MSFKIKRVSKRAEYHGKIIQDASGGYYLLEYQNDGSYQALNKHNVVVGSQVSYSRLKGHILDGTWKIYDERPNI